MSYSTSQLSQLASDKVHNQLSYKALILLRAHATSSISSKLPPLSAEQLRASIGVTEEAIYTVLDDLATASCIQISPAGQIKDISGMSDVLISLTPKGQIMADACDDFKSCIQQGPFYVH